MRNTIAASVLALALLLVPGALAQVDVVGTVTRLPATGALDEAGDYTLTGAWDFTGASVSGISGVGEANTLTSQGAGISLVSGKVGVDLRTNSLVSANSYLTIVLDDPNDEIDFTIDLDAIEAAINLTDITTGTLADARIASTIARDSEVAAAYLPLAGGTLTGALTLDNLGITGTASDTNPACASGDYRIYVDLSEAAWKKCTNGSVTDLDTSGGGGSLPFVISGTEVILQDTTGSDTRMDMTDNGNISLYNSSGVVSLRVEGNGVVHVNNGHGNAADFRVAGNTADLDVMNCDVSVDGCDYEGDHDYATGTWRGPRSTTLPATCNVGEQYFDTDATAGQNLYGCTAANTWTLLGDGGGGGGGDVTAAGNNTYTGTNDFSGAELELPNSTTLPATCNVGETYFDSDATAGENLYGCTAANTWSVLGGNTANKVTKTIAASEPTCNTGAQGDFWWDSDGDDEPRWCDGTNWVIIGHPIKLPQIKLADNATTVTSSDIEYIQVPEQLVGWHVQDIECSHVTVGSSGTGNTTVDVDICSHTVSQSVCGGTVTDISTTDLTIDTGELSSESATTAAALNNGATFAAREWVRVQTTATETTGTAPQGLRCTVELAPPNYPPSI